MNDRTHHIQEWQEHLHHKVSENVVKTYKEDQIYSQPKTPQQFQPSASLLPHLSPNSPKHLHFPPFHPLKMPVPLLVGAITGAATPDVRNGVVGAIGTISSTTGGGGRKKSDSSNDLTKCQISHCRYTVEEVTFHDTVSDNVTVSDVRVNFPVPERSRFYSKGGLCGIPLLKFEQCKKDLKNVIIKTSVPEPNGKFCSAWLWA